jgi:hypothetical protein
MQDYLTEIKTLIQPAKDNETFKIQWKNKWREIIDNAPPNITVEDLSLIIQFVKTEWKLSENELLKYTRKISVIELLGSYPKTPDEFVELYTTKKKISIRLDSLINPSYIRGICSLVDLYDELYAFNIDNFLRIDKKRLEIALNTWYNTGLSFCLISLSDYVTDRFASKQDAPKNLEAEKEWDKFINIIDKNDNKRIYTKAIMKHFIWNVKRVMNPQTLLGTVNPIMPVLVGRTGNGKSTAIDNFISPLKNGGYVKTDFDKLLDPNYYIQNANTPIAFLDEMARLSTADQNNLKAFITSDIITARKFHTQMIEHKSKIIQLIGTSNYSLSVISNDTTSSRRFYEIETPDDMKSKNSFWYEKINWLLLWQSIDPTTKSPLSSKLANDVFTIQQNQQRKKNYVEEWIWSEQITGGWKSATEVFNNWRDWASTNDTYHYSKANFASFGRELTAIEGVTKKNNGKIFYYFDIDFSKLAGFFE